MPQSPRKGTIGLRLARKETKVSTIDNSASYSRAFQQLGFTDYEARVYVALLQRSPATAYEISKLGSLPRPNVYSALESLEKKAAVQPVSESPIRYIPVEPRQLLGRIARETVTRCDALKDKLDNIKPADNKQYVWMISNGESATAKINDMILNAKRHVWIKAHETVLTSHFAALKKAAAKGVKVLLIIFGAPQDAKRFGAAKNMTVYLHEGNGFVVGLGHTLVTITTDFNEALVVNTREEDPFGAFTQSRPVVNLAESLIRHEVYLAEIFNAFEPQLEKRFGRALISLRQKYLPSDQVKTLERSLRSSASNGTGAKSKRRSAS
jgi:sugar-specific transcriptional regulator TrmB